MTNKSLLKDVEFLLGTQQSMDESRKNRINFSKENPNQFSTWFSAVKSVFKTGKYNFSVPETLTIELPPEILWDIESDDGVFAECRSYCKMIEPEVADFINTHALKNVFIKNSLNSIKHDFGHCKFDSNFELKTLIGCVTTNLYVGQMLFPDIPNEMVFREFIPTNAAFIAHGETPITEEYRFFATKDKAISYQPYWPKDSIRQPSVDDWEERLKNLYQITDQEIKELSTIAVAVVKELGIINESWSVDFLRGADGKFYLIDMATAESSYVSPEVILLDNNQ